ncbi:hypothetical protein IVA80_15215 [Bradyrhizobium sp. 139]|uniref:hypothetical protein n=1 Tax=Bradyrhizobium sp. 139 TaxID=2782616 RepID=UPI001FFA7D2E|nr:hypothetical protein [Bradyrhizobium sp. 139]MCK1742173.1 hypothetical protein [Bradyrhizobium sp. 139]
MTAVKINAFGGAIPATDSRVLPDQAAALSQNAWLYSGALQGVISPKPVRPMTNAGFGKAYRIPNNYYDAAHLEDAVWMEFANIDTDVLRSPVVGDSFDRYYWASPSDVPRVNSLARIRSASAPYKLGVIPPTGTPTLALTGGVSSSTEARAYVVTWLSAFGEEGPPSSPVLATGKPDATWTLSLPAAAGADQTDYNLSKARIYRTVTGTTGTATFFFVAEVAIATASYADTLATAVVSANAQLPSTSWSPPPADLQGFVSMPNGMIAGWRGKELWFSEPFRAHAWPAAYTNVVEFPIVGLGVTNQTLVICTAGYPMVATGINPSSISLSKLSAFEPCMSRGSIVAAPEGVYYASPNGLVLVANGIAQLVTDGLVMKDEWSNLMQVATMRATRVGNGYFAFGTKRVGFTDSAFQADAWQQDDFSGSYKGVFIDPTNQRVAFNSLTTAVPTTNVFNDPWSGETLIIRDDELYRLDLSDETSARDTFLWRSKVFQPTDKKNFAVMRVYFDVPPWAPTQNPVRDTSEPQTLKPDQYGLVRIYADNRLVMTRELRSSGEILRFPSGFKADFWQVEFEAVVRIMSFQMATSVKELMKV